MEDGVVRRLLAAALLAAPGLAAACASCARDAGRWTQLLVAAMAFFPFAVAGVVAGVVRHASGTDPRGADPEAGT